MVKTILKILVGLIVIAGLVGAFLPDVNSDIRKAIEQGKPEKIVQIYSQAKNIEEKENLGKQISIEYLKWLEKLKKEDRFATALTDQLEVYVKNLSIVDEIDSDHLLYLEEIRDHVEKIISNDKELKNFSPTLKYIKKNGSAQWINTYVVRKVDNILGIDLPGNIKDGYTAEFQIMGYKSALGRTYPTGDNEAIAIFKKSSNVKEGVTRFYAIHLEDKTFSRSNGFEVKLPVYLEVTEEEIKYSDAVDEYRSQRKFSVEAIYKIIERGNQPPEKSEKPSKETTPIKTTKQVAEELIYGKWEPNPDHHYSSEWDISKYPKYDFNADNCMVLDADANQIDQLGALFWIEYKKGDGAWTKRRASISYDPQKKQYKMRLEYIKPNGNVPNDGSPDYIKK